MSDANLDFSLWSLLLGLIFISLVVAFAWLCDVSSRLGDFLVAIRDLQARVGELEPQDEPMRAALYGFTPYEGAPPQDPLPDEFNQWKDRTATMPRICKHCEQSLDKPECQLPYCPHRPQEWR
jgi:hypothetical protein